MSFKDRLKEKRLEANLTQVQLAEKVSVNARTIQNYESGTANRCGSHILPRPRIAERNVPGDQAQPICFH